LVISKLANWQIGSLFLGFCIGFVVRWRI